MLLLRASLLPNLLMLLSLSLPVRATEVSHEEDLPPALPVAQDTTEPAPATSGAEADNKPLTPDFTLLGSEIAAGQDRKSTRLNSSHVKMSYAVFCLQQKQ